MRQLAATVLGVGLAACLLCGCSTRSIRNADMRSRSSSDGTQLQPPINNTDAEVVISANKTFRDRNSGGLLPGSKSASREESKIYPIAIPNNSNSDHSNAAADDRCGGICTNVGGAPLDPKRIRRPEVDKPDNQVREQLAASLDDSQLGAVRGGVDLGSGVELNFAFQQATFVDHNLVQNVVIPTLTVSQSAGSNSAVSGISETGDVQVPTFSAPSFAGLAMTGMPSANVTTVTSASTVTNNGTTLQITSPGAGIPTVVGNGAASVVTTLGGGGLTNIIANTANNQLVQQTTTINIGITGLQQLLQQAVPASVMNQINSTNALRH